MEQNILISVLIPTYNVEKFIRAAIESVVNQTYSNLEIIVVDDGSTDQTYSILKEIELLEPRLKLYKNKVNSGIVKTLNFGLSVSRGEYIVRMDGDDLCDSTKFEKQLRFLLNNKNVDLVGCDILSIDENDNILNHIKTSHSVECTKKLLGFISPVLHIWMCKKEIYTILEGYRDLGGSEDYDFLLRLDALGFKFFNLPFYGYSVRIRNGNTQTSRGLYQRKIVYYIRKLYKERLMYNYDSFNVKSRDNSTKSSLLVEGLHKLSVKYTYKAMKYRRDKNYLMFILAIMLSLVSPYQMRFYIENLLVKYYLNKYK
jgi:glycosyltransferase involved in cell wall biosynthesis